MAVLDDLEQAAMLIVLETPRRAGSGGYSTQSYVRRDLIAMLETALRKRGCDVDAGLRHMKAWRKEEKAKSDAKIAAYKGESESEEARAERLATYQTAMKARRDIP